MKQNNITEETHMPDFTNITHIVTEITHMCKYALYYNLINKIKNRSFESNFDLIFYIKSSDLNYIPDWLDYNFNIDVEIHLEKSDNLTIYNEFDGFFDKSECYLKPNDDNKEFPYRLCGMNFGLINKNYLYKDLSDIDHIFYEIKEALRHEFSHAYEKYIELKRKTLYDNIIIRTETNGYKHSEIKINEMLKSKISNNINDDEYYFLRFVYHMMYCERSANINGFYELVHADFPDIKDISSYKLYERYYSFIKYIDDFNNDSIYNKYKQDLINLFGKCCKRKDSFKTELYNRCVDTLKRMKDVYCKAKFEKNDITLKYDIKPLTDAYDKYVQLLLGDLTENLSENELSKYKSNFENYILKDFDIVRQYILKTV